MAFTGNPDTDNSILLSLEYQSVKQFCTTSQYVKQLCHQNVLLKQKIKKANDRANYIIKLNRYRYTLMFHTENQLFSPIHDIINFLNLIEHDDKNLNQYNDDSLYDLYIIQHLDNIYHIHIETKNANDMVFYLTLNDLKNFLFCLFYNDLILIY